ncbi:hypothetical protein SDC9_154883 [bioreactor metagenome]|uniref:Uncharacterized protein n=1 Tax=bioreactor metagenome TaxID=1076179 RepID=A0A645F281_9ZZZZ
MCGVDFNQVESCVHRAFCGIFKTLNQIHDFFNSQNMGNSFPFQIGNWRWSHGFPTFFQGNLLSVPGGTLSPGMTQLDSDFGFGVFMHEFYNFAESCCLFVIPDSGAFVGNPSFGNHAGRFHDNQSGSALGAASVMHEMKVVRNTVLAGIHAHRRHDPAVFQFKVAEFYF